MSCYPPCNVEPGHRAGELLVLCPDLAANGPAIRPKEQRGRTDSESVIFGMRPGIIPPQPAHIIDHAEWNDGECGKCGGKTPYCKRCGVTWCVGCESQTCKVSASQEI